MAHFEDRAAGRQTFPASTSITDVNGDMVAIFGPDQRIDPKPTGRTQSVRPSSRRGMIIATFLGVAGLMLAAGVVGGKSVLNAASSGASATSGVYKAANFPLPNSRQEAALASRVQRSPVLALKSEPEKGAPTPAIAPIQPVTASATTASARQSAGSGLADAGLQPVPDVVPRRSAIFVQSAASADVARPAAVEDRRAKSTPPIVGRPSCSLNGCVDPRLPSDEQEVASAYQEATIAGVRSRTLRDYRAEWVRARGLASKRPAEAARIYGMIKSALRLLAADPTID